MRTDNGSDDEERRYDILPEKPLVYLAGAFCQPPAFTATLNTTLKEKGYRTVIRNHDGPARQGLEDRFLQAQLPPEEAQEAARLILFYYTLGKVIPESKMIIASLDAYANGRLPVELMYANRCERPVVGYFRDPAEGWREGFLHQECQLIVDARGPDEEMGKKVGEAAIGLYGQRRNHNGINSQIYRQEFNKQIRDNALRLFNGYNHNGTWNHTTPEALDRIVENFLKDKDRFEKLDPLLPQPPARRRNA
jgi:hypothetical protein